MKVILALGAIYLLVMVACSCDDSHSALEIWEEEQGLEYSNYSWDDLREMKCGNGL